MLAIRQKPNKPLAVDARCLLRAIGAVPSENPQASLDIFSQPHITPSRSCIHRKAINKDKPSLSSGVLPSRQQSCVCRLPGTPPSSVYQVTHGTALQAAECCVRHLVMVIPSRQQSAMCSICPARIVLEDCHAIGHSSVLSA